MPPENDQQILGGEDIGDAELQQWLTSVGDGADITLPGLDIGVPHGSTLLGATRQVADQDPNGNGEDPDDTDPDLDPDLDPDGDDPPETPPAQPTGDTTPDTFAIGDGRTITRADAERLYNFDQYLKANADVAQRVNAAITGQPPTATPPGQPPVPPPAPPASAVKEWEEPTPPDFLDLEDPAQKFSWDTHVATQKALFERDQRDQRLFAQQAQDRQQSNVRQAQADMATALQQFTAAHPNLNEDDIKAIRQAAGPFIGGMMQQLSPVEALVRSMEVGGMMDENLRTKLTDPTVRTKSERQQSRHRKARLGEIGSSGRSAPKTESRPAFVSDKDFLNGLAEGFREAMQQ